MRQKSLKLLPFVLVMESMNVNPYTLGEFKHLEKKRQGRFITVKTKKKKKMEQFGMP